MPPRPPEEWFTTEQVGDATVVRFTPNCSRYLTDETVQLIVDALTDLQGPEGGRRLVLNLTHVERMDSLLLGKLAALHKRALAAGGSLLLCNLSPPLYEVFQTLRLTGFLRIYATEREALEH